MTPKERAPMVCARCQRGPAPEHGGVTVFKEGDEWLCREHRTRPSPDDDLIDVLESRNER